MSWLKFSAQETAGYQGYLTGVPVANGLVEHIGVGKHVLHIRHFAGVPVTDLVG